MRGRKICGQKSAGHRQKYLKCGKGDRAIKVCIMLFRSLPYTVNKQLGAVRVHLSSRNQGCGLGGQLNRNLGKLIESNWRKKRNTSDTFNKDKSRHEGTENDKTKKTNK